MSAFRPLFFILLFLTFGCCPNPERVARGDAPSGLFGKWMDELHGIAASDKKTDSAPVPTIRPTLPSPKPPPPLESVPTGDQALHMAVAKGYLQGLSGEQNWKRRFQVSVDGRKIWEGELVFGDAQGPSQPEVAWLPAPILTARGAHEFAFRDLTVGTEITGTYACAWPQCWGVVTYAKNNKKLDLIEFMDSEPKLE